MSNVVAVASERPVRSLLVSMSERYGMEPAAFEQTLRATVVPGSCSKEQLAAFLLVAKEYELNPITKEIYAFPTKGGGIQPIVGIDGWMNIINSHPNLDGMEFVDTFDDKGKLTAITCQIYRKDRSHPTSVTEYMDECKRDTEPWKKWPARMLRHKAAIQAARYAFGFSGIIEPDEFDRGELAREAQANSTTPPAPPMAEAPTKLIQQLRESLDVEEMEAIDIPPELDRRKKAEPVSEELDPDVYLDDLDARMAGTKTEDYLNEIWAEHLEVSPSLFPPDREKAEEIYRKHQRRLLEPSEKKAK